MIAPARHPRSLLAALVIALGLAMASPAFATTTTTPRGETVLLDESHRADPPDAEPVPAPEGDGSLCWDGARVAPRAAPLLGALAAEARAGPALLFAAGVLLA